jgi:hypothetical protein
MTIAGNIMRLGKFDPTAIAPEYIEYITAISSILPTNIVGKRIHFRSIGSLSAQINMHPQENATALKSPIG